MQELFYTPALEDLHVGYQCQIYEGFSCLNEHKVNTPSEISAYWVTKIIERGDIVPWESADSIFETLEEGRIRTPFLTREAIEAEEWEYVADDEYLIELNFKRAIDGLTYYFRKIGNIAKFWLNEDVTLFDGNIPSINEFRRICKMVGIEKKPAQQSIPQERLDAMAKANAVNYRNSIGKT